RMRAIFPMYDSPFHAVALSRSNISTLPQLTNKQFGVGPRAGTPGTYIPEFMKTLGIAAHINNGSFSEMGKELLTGRFDAVGTIAGAPFPAIEDAGAKEALTFISLATEEMQALTKAMPEFSPSKIPAGTYTALAKDYVTIGLYNFAIARDDLPD